MRSKRYVQRQATMAAVTATSPSVRTPRFIVEPKASDSTEMLAESPSESNGHSKRTSLPWVVAVVLFMAVASAFVMRQAEVMSVQKSLTAIEQEIEHYKALNESLQAQVDALKSDEYIEKAAREKLGLVMPGEIQYMVVDYNSKD